MDGGGSGRGRGIRGVPAARRGRLGAAAEPRRGRSCGASLATPRSGVTFIECRLRPDEITSRDGIPVTTVARTLLDLAAVLPRDRLERAVHEAEYRRYADAPSLPELIERHRGARGLGRLRSILDEGGVGERLTRSELEERFLTLVAKHDLPRPEVNVSLRLNDRWIEADCVWRDQRLIVELDGAAAHHTRRAFERDRERDRVVQAAGWTVVRITWRQLVSESAAVVADLRRLLTEPRYPHAP